MEEAKKVGPFEGMVGGACHAYEEVLLTYGSVSSRSFNNSNNNNTKSVCNNGLVHYWCKLLLS